MYLVKRFYIKVRGRNILVLFLSTSVCLYCLILLNALLLSDQTPKAIKSKVVSDRTPINIKSPPSSLERVINSDANFDRDNPSSLSSPSSSSNDTKLPPSSSERVINSDTNFDRDNPSLSALSSNEFLSSSEQSLSTLSFNVLLSDRTPKASKPPPASVSYKVLSDRTPNNILSSNVLPPLSYNVLSDRTPNNIKSPPLSIKSPLSSSERVTNSDANFDRDNPSLPAALSLSSPNDTNSSSSNDNKSQPLSNCNNNNNNNNNNDTVSITGQPLSNCNNNSNDTVSITGQPLSNCNNNSNDTE
jgi:hypothetical protein